MLFHAQKGILYEVIWLYKNAALKTNSRTWYSPVISHIIKFIKRQHFFQLCICTETLLLGIRDTTAFCLKAEDLFRKKFEDSDDIIMLSTYSQIYICLNSSEIKTAWLSYCVLFRVGRTSFPRLSVLRCLMVAQRQGTGDRMVPTSPRTGLWETARAQLFTPKAFQVNSLLFSSPRLF